MSISKSPYKELNFPKIELESSIKDFCESNLINFIRLSKSTEKQEYYELTKIGSEKAQFQVFHLNNGKTTFNPKVGKNQKLSTELAEHLLKKANLSKGQVTSVLMGYTIEDVEPIIELMRDKKHPSGQSFFEFERKEIEGGFRFSIKNCFYKDKLTVNIYNTGKLLIQGIPLSCHDEFIFQMSSLLDAEGLAKVISRTDENTVQLVDLRLIEEELVCIFKESYEHMPISIKNMLISGRTLQSINLELSDYTYILFPDLRALEGVLRNVFFLEDIECNDTLGELFEYISTHNYKLKSEVQAQFSSSMGTALSNAYNFYHRHRHGLFHMNNVVNSSRTITTSEKAIQLSDDIYVIIKDIYKSSL